MVHLNHKLGEKMTEKKCIQSYDELLSRLSQKNVVIFGAGNYGYKLCSKLREDISPERIVFCDNAPEKQGSELLGCRVLSVETAVSEYGNAFFLIVVKNVSGYAEDMLRQISYAIDAENIILVSLSSLYTDSVEQRFWNAEKYIENAIQSRRESEKLEKVEEVKSITFRNRLKDGTGGGPAKVLEMQEKILGYDWGNIKLSYQYKMENKISLGLNHALSGYLGPVEFARLICEKDRNTVYIAHDIFSAFGLAVSGKHYILVYHSQGEAVFETRNMGNQITCEEEKLLKQIELETIQRADFVCFPSIGAEEFFWKSWGIQSIPEYSKGSTLYNCLISQDMEECEAVEGLLRNEEVCTILSIGQMTSAKGMDRIPEFLDKLSVAMKKEIRWIVVANGPLKDEVLKETEKISEKGRVKTVHFDKLMHSQINYLFSISDGYLMLHRISIFDLSTLEAMYHNLFIMLSDIPGNREYNLHNNIIMIANDANYEEIVRKIDRREKSNREVYDKAFGVNNFKKRYLEMISMLVEKSVRGSVIDETK